MSKTEFMLSEVSNIVSVKAPISEASLDNYISTENMLPDFGGVTKAEKLPVAYSVNTFLYGDILFSNIRTYFKKVWSSKFNGTVSPDVLVFRANETKCTNKYLYYTLCNSEFIELSILSAKGAKMPRGDKDAMLKYTFSLPPLSEQQAIAEVLSSLDDKIELLHRNNKTLEEMAETLFRQWFVEGAKEDWMEVKLGDYIKLESGYSYRSVDLQPSKTALVTLKNFNRNGGFRLDGFKEYTGKHKSEQLVSMGDLVVAHTDITQEADVLGNPAIIIDDGRYDKLVISTDLVKVIPTKFLSKSYLYYLMRQPDFKHYCIGSSNGTTVLHLSKKALPDYEFRLPNVDLVIKFTGLVEPIFEKIGKNIKHINQLETSRDTLLPKLMSGQVRVNVRA